MSGTRRRSGFGRGKMAERPWRGKVQTTTPTGGEPGPVALSVANSAPLRDNAPSPSTP